MQASIHTTRVLPVDTSRIGDFMFASKASNWLDEWQFSLADSKDARNLAEAAKLLKTSNTPVAFPTETVYGLGADASRSEAVQGIYQAKQRPSDNPLIVHICSLSQLRGILRPTGTASHHAFQNGHQFAEIPSGTGTTITDRINEPGHDLADLIPSIYHPLITKFWPGPLTIILPNPPDSTLAPEVTAGLNTFGARMPDHPLALALIKLAGVPLAAPSANASTKPSPTAAEHVKEDLDGRIDVILDAGPCSVGVESTVVDGLSKPPAILRPGGISIEQLRQCKGWEDVVVGYKDAPEHGTKPKAPGMKYRHYSPKAKVVLYEAGSWPPSTEELLVRRGGSGTVGVIRTKNWMVNNLDEVHSNRPVNADNHDLSTHGFRSTSPLKLNQAAYGPHGSNTTHPSVPPTQMKPSDAEARLLGLKIRTTSEITDNTSVWDFPLGPDISDIARGIFSALRELDRKGVDTIFVEGISDTEGDLAAAVMNRLRKAAV
ncbi:MAG: High affinity Ca2+/Mn2+ P-type ATPase-like protein [Watsoniomyces obsoletus]|nr:MAG: High affinity Ca2+/Mn2+ P-type ATPase-like protein [Watsoniomyces obsoletus]